MHQPQPVPIGRSSTCNYCGHFDKKAFLWLNLCHGFVGSAEISCIRIVLHTTTAVRFLIVC